MPIDTSPTELKVNEDSDYSLAQLDDEESFVVLERSTSDGNEILSEQNTRSYLPSQISYSFPAFNNFLSNGFIPSQIPFLNQPDSEIGEHLSPQLESINSNHSSIIVKELEEKLKEVVQENMNMKDIVCQTNLAMKQQLKTVSLMQDRAQDAQRNQQEKFEEIKSLLQEENKGLKGSNEALQNEISKLQEEHEGLKGSNEALENEISKLQEENKGLKGSNEVLQNEISKLQEENKGMKGTNETLQNEISNLVAENKCLENQLALRQQSLEHTNESTKIAASELWVENETLKKCLYSTEQALQHAIESGKKTVSQQSTKEIEQDQLVCDLTRKLEMVERVRRDQEFKLDRLQAQLGRMAEELTDTKQKLAHSENALQTSQSQLITEHSTGCGSKLTKYKWMLQNLIDPQDEEEKRESFSAAIGLVREILIDFQNLGEMLERTKADHAVKESHGLQYDEMQKKGFQEKLDSLTAKLVEKEELLAISERHLSSLQEAIRLENAENQGGEEVKTLQNKVKNMAEEINAKNEEIKASSHKITDLQSELQKLNEKVIVLEEQANIFKTDFETERKERESVITEKESILADFRNLLRRNEDLMKEVLEFRNKLPNENDLLSASQRTEELPPPSTPKPQDDIIPAPKRYFCPNPECNMTFTTVDPLELHVITCLKLDF